MDHHQEASTRKQRLEHGIEKRKVILANKPLAAQRLFVITEARAVRACDNRDGVVVGEVARLLHRHPVQIGELNLRAEGRSARGRCDALAHGPEVPEA